MDKLIPLIGIIFLCFVGLGGSEDILSKKRAWLSIIWTNIRQAKGMVEKGRAKWRSHPYIVSISSKEPSTK